MLCGSDKGARVVRTDALLAATSPHPLLNNAILLRADALADLFDFYRDVGSFAVWTAAGDVSTEAALRDTGFAVDVTTRPMLCARACLPRGIVDPEVDIDAAPARVAEPNGVAAQVLENVSGLRCFATTGDECGLLLQEVADDVVMSFVATRPSARGRGLATWLITAALSDARSRGAATVALQATPQAEGIYRRLGFTPVGSWQEWTPPHDGASAD